MIVRETIVRWRYGDVGTIKSLIGFWFKFGIEFFGYVGVPVAILVILATSIAGIALSDLPYVPQSSRPNIIAWITLTAIGYREHQCIYADGIAIMEQEGQNQQ